MRRVVPGPIGPSRKEKKFHLHLTARARATRVSFSFASALECCLFTTYRRPTDPVREQEIDSRRIHPVERAQFWNDSINID